MAKRKAPNSGRKGDATSAGAFAVLTNSEAKARKREISATALREQGGGLLQLRLGRAAQGQGLGAAFGLAFNAFLIYAASQSGTILNIPPAYLDALLWILPLFVGAVIAIDAIQRKWIPYKGYRASRHFILSVGALVLSFRETSGGSCTPSR